ncbi:DUF2190 family protein [Parachitinimonas caeni]|uniref:DUF2190 family protein n=1 Tax=Parachitinimonas caeni TaxID=3031301 RepID=A0ABT7DVT6_9NEIS|nr:DUF2190 family protein [Parachitinimonas caeni]MDK2124153.1 DUF2190 family protein [Parachitinimonas caeni]
MARNFVKSGQVMDVRASSPIRSGEVVVLGKRLGVALGDIAVNQLGAVQMQGVFLLPKNPADAVSQGDLLYWNASNRQLTSTASGNTLAGYAFAPAAAGSSSAELCLNG